MATANTIRLLPSTAGIFHVPDITSAAAKTASQVLQRNHQDNDIVFNDAGFHNHIVHHVLATYALGASPSAIQRHYDFNASYQRPPPNIKMSVIDHLHDPEMFIKAMGPKENYSSFRLFFETECEKSSVPEVLNKYVFQGDKRANTLFNRLYAGFLHPIIHLGYGVEFQQPAIVAEALGQACIHDKWQDTFFELVDQHRQKFNPPRSSLVSLLDKIRADEKLRTAVHWEDDNKIRDGILVRAKDEMVEYASQWQVPPEEDQIKAAAAEIISADAYFTGAAQNPPKQIKFDFFNMHCINASIFFTSFIDQPWISLANKAKLLEWKGRLDLALYASRRSPNLLLDEITTYPRKDGQQLQNWDEIFRRANEFDDDGHASKFVRALAHGEQYCKPYEAATEKFRVRGLMWRQLAMMVMDSVEDSGNRWVRSAGFAEAWESFGNRGD